MNDKRQIIHVDLNSFFATAEQQANLTLRGKPVGIIKATGRTCIIAASVEAKQFKVKTGSDVFEARKLCPGIILVPADFSKYADITYRFINICKNYSPICEVFSLDECFVDVTESEKFWGNVFNIAFEIKQRLRIEIGDHMTCSIGISHNKFLAKLASNQIKPNGLFWITRDNALKILDKTDLMDVCGLGWGLYNHLIKLGIDTFWKLRVCSMQYLYQHFGPFWSEHLYNLARGIDNSPILSLVDIPDAKSVGRTYTTHRLLSNKGEIYKLVRNLCEEATFKARSMRLAGRYIGFSLRGGGDNFFGHKTLKTYINDGKSLFNICLQISKGWPLKKIRFCGVTLAMLTRKDYMPMPLYTSDQKHKELTVAEDKINNRFGDYTVFPARLLRMDIIRSEVTGYFGDKKYRLDFANQT